MGSRVRVEAILGMTCFYSSEKEQLLGKGGRQQEQRNAFHLLLKTSSCQHIKFFESHFSQAELA